MKWPSFSFSQEWEWDPSSHWLSEISIPKNAVIEWASMGLIWIPAQRKRDKLYLSLSMTPREISEDLLPNKILIFELARLPHVEPIGDDAWEFRKVREVMELQKHCEAIELLNIRISQSGTFEIPDCPTQRNGKIWH